MTPIHKELALGRWHAMSLVEQLANIGSEVSRVTHWHTVSDQKGKGKAVERALELLDLTIADEKNRSRLSELLRLREVFCDTFLGENIYGVSPEYLDEYFLQFGVAANRERFKE